MLKEAAIFGYNVNMETWWIWMALAALLLAAEVARSKSFFLWISIGAAFSGILALLAVPVAGQVVVCVNVSGILILLERRFSERYMFKPPSSAPPPEARQVSAPAQDNENVFRKSGEVWEIRYAGECLIAKHSIGLVHIRNLIIHSGQWMHCSELKRISAENHESARYAVYGTMSADQLELENLRAGASLPPEKMVDRLSLEQIRKLRAILAERKASDAFSSPEERLDQLRTLDFIQKYLGSVTDKSGRPRTILDQEDADRKAVSVAIHRSRNNLGKHSELHIHFKSFIQAEANSFRYLPDRPIEWKTR